MTLGFIDASSAILLHKAALFDLCASHLRLMMAAAVFDEITRDGYPGADYFLDAQKKRMFKVLDTGPLQIEEGRKELMRMGRGERETILQYRRFDCIREPAFVILDDRRGAVFCRNRNIPYINALLIPKIFWYSGRMTESEFKQYTNTLLEIGRYGKAVIQKAKALNETDLARFLTGRCHG
ncbi:MAG: hypothetical protein MI802_02990 [Desulfobacterales bacterium]|nr:hypothetical protein [Desulfobacterales bacterium]